MIQEAYVSFEVAKLLKEKGFDGDCGDCECHMFYHEMTDRIMPIMEIGLIPDYDDVYFAPTHQMAMKWLREEKHKFISIIPTLNDIGSYAYAYDIIEWNENNDFYEITRMVSFQTYEEAVEAALKYVLENLI